MWPAVVAVVHWPAKSENRTIRDEEKAGPDVDMPCPDPLKDDSNITARAGRTRQVEGQVAAFRAQVVSPDPTQTDAQRRQ